MGAGMDSGGLLGWCEGAKRRLKSARRSSAWGSVHTAFCAAADRARTSEGQVHLWWSCPAGNASHGKVPELQASSQASAAGCKCCWACGMTQLDQLQAARAAVLLKMKTETGNLQPVKEVSHSRLHLPARRKGWLRVAGWKCCCCQCPAAL